MEHKRMNDTAVGAIVVILLICAAASLAVLFDILVNYNPEGFQNVIPLTESGNGTKVTVTNAKAPAEVASGSPIETAAKDSSAAEETSQGGKAEFKAYDKDTVWSAETEVEIFKLSYDNESGAITVKSDDNVDKLLAPGTSNEYTFTLENTGDVTLDYTMSMEAWFGSEDYWIPVTARVYSYDGSYLLGDGMSRADVLELNTVSDGGVLGAGRCMVYTLEWEWEFERGDDSYDTMLGNRAVDEDLTLTVKILTTAMADNDPDNTNTGLPNPDPGKTPGGGHIVNPHTGEITALGKTLLCLVGALLIAIVSIFINRHKDDEGEDEA